MPHHLTISYKSYFHEMVCVKNELIQYSVRTSCPQDMKGGGYNIFFFFDFVVHILVYNVPLLISTKRSMCPQKIDSTFSRLVELFSVTKVSHDSGLIIICPTMVDL